MAGWVSAIVPRVRLRSGMPKPAPAVERTIRAELSAARREGCRVILLTGNHRGQLRAFGRYRRLWRGRWRVVSPPDPTLATDTLRRMFPDASASLLANLLKDGVAGPLAGLARSATRAVARRLLGQQPPTLDGIPAHLDEFVRYLRAYATGRPTIVTAELSGPAAHELLRALAVIVKNTPEMRDSPIVAVVGVDEIAVERLRTEDVVVPTGNRFTVRQDALPDLRLAVLPVAALDERRTRHWLGSVDAAVTATLLMASGRDDLEAALVWQRWTSTGAVKRKSSVWSLSPRGWTEAADQLEVTVASRLPESMRPVARRILHAAALFGVEFGRGPVVAAVAEDTAQTVSVVDEGLRALCDFHIFDRGKPSGSDNLVWSDPRFRDHALRDLALAALGEDRSLALRVARALSQTASAASIDRNAAVRLSRLHRDRDNLVQLSRTIEGGRDPRLAWSALLTFARIEIPSVTLAQNLASAAIDARNSGYLQMAAALADAGIASVRTVASIDQTTRLSVLGRCGRALTRSSTTRARAADLIREVLEHADQAATDVLLTADRVELEHDLGIALRDLDQIEPSIRHLNEAKRLQELADLEHGGDRTRGRRLAITLYELGRAYRDRVWTGTDPDRMDQAIRLFQAARRTFLDANHGVRVSEDDVRDGAECLFAEAVAWWAVGAGDDLIEAQLRQAADELRSLSELASTPTIQSRLAGLELELYRCYVRQDRQRDAEAAAARALTHARAAYTADPSAEHEHKVKAAVEAADHFTR